MRLDQIDIDSAGAGRECDAEIEIGPRVAARRVEQPAFDQILGRSEEHTSELQSLMRISYAVFCLKKKNQNTQCPKSLTLENNPQTTHQNKNKCQNKNCNIDKRMNTLL